MKILIIEDEVKAVEYLKKGLEEEGFSVDFAHDGETGLALALSVPYVLVILDVMLPKRNGWSVLEKLREQKIQIPVLLLTAVADVSNRVKGLELGADDYLVKPFAYSELRARVRTLLRRGQIAPQATVLKVADLELDMTRQRATRAGTILELRPKEFQLLNLLMQRKGEVLSRIIIAEMIWEIHFDTGTNFVDVHIRRLRSKVDDGFSVSLIHTVRGAGYVLRDCSEPI